MGALGRMKRKLVVGKPGKQYRKKPVYSPAHGREMPRQSGTAAWQGGGRQITWGPARASGGLMGELARLMSSEG